MIAVPHYISPKEYLAIERRSPIRHEYRYGLVYAMAGGSDNHDRIAYNLLKLIDNHFGDETDCQFFSGNVKINYADALYYYPDAFVTCDERDKRDRYIKRYPKLIVEVLSSSTQDFDQADKFEDYKQIDTLEEYVLISQTNQRVECHRRIAKDQWKTEIYQEGDRISLKSIGLTIEISELYRGLNR